MLGRSLAFQRRGAGIGLLACTDVVGGDWCMRRRHALQLLGSLAAVPTLRALRGDELVRLGERVHASLAAASVPRVLSAAQYAAVSASAEHIIPRTNTPGATDARVADFVDAMLADWYSPAERDRFLQGVDALDALARQTCGTAFTSCTEAQRLAMLTSLDDQVTALRATDGKAANEHWFGMLKFLTVWGYYTSRAGMVDELHENLLPGYYDGDVPYRLPSEAPHAP